ncbi:MAG: NUDIX domain-containing protein [Actinomycetota bacterium]|nr:NUDIX domain-containing protein [Actinomycetota bacterium]
MSLREEIRDPLRRFPRHGVRRWGVKRAAVAITVVIGGSGPEILFTRHATALRNHPGPYALPGRRIRTGESAPDAARRELAEQLGMQLPPKSVLGLLDDYEARSGFVITPVVIWAGEHAGPLHLREARQEDRGCTVPFTDLDVEPVFVAIPGSDRPVIRLPLHGEWLHAPTAAVLYQFREVVMYRRRTRVAHLAEPIFARR